MTFLTNNKCRAQDSAVAAKSAIGIGVPDTKAHSRASQRGFFVRSARARSCNGRAVRGAFGLTGPWSGTPTRTVPPTPIGVWVAEIQTATKEAIMPNSTPTPHPVPSAWYDLSARVSQARAVASCISGALPVRLDSFVNIDHIGNLAGAVDDLLALAEQDVERLELQLKGA